MNRQDLGNNLSQSLTCSKKNQSDPFIVMATSRIKSDLYSFDENIFYISQAQRYFIKYCLEHLPEGEDWIYEYLTDLYFDSLNNEFKSFYLEEIDEHKIVSDDHRRSIISGLLENSISELSKK